MEAMAIFASISLIFLCISPPITTFNVDISVPIVKEGDSNSYFGYSVAQHHVSDTSDSRVILVGAPLGNISHYRATDADRNLVRPGVIFSCPVSSSKGDCTELFIDEPGDKADKDDKWLGVSVASQGTAEGKAVACAHRYKNAGTGYSWGPGICTVMYNSLDEDSFLEPCFGKDVSTGHGSYGLCQSGTSLDVSEDGDVLLGVPGAYNWRGSVFKNMIRESLQESPTWYPSPVEDPPKEDPASVPPPIPLGYYSYMGMSSTIGRLVNGEKTYIAGAPRSEGTGQVMLFTQGGTENDYLEVEPDQILSGEQFGANFGYATVTLDLNNDRKEDLVVSAPFYHGTGIGGAIYVYMNGEDGITTDTKPLRIVSPKISQKECNELDCHNSKFGLSLAALGDIDWDGYDDLAVGAPFEGPGAVYIYRGSATGIQEEYSQRITAEDLLLARPMVSFGSSLTGGMDMDGNGYPDLIVGAYESNKALILRSRPVVDVTSYYEINPDKIDPQEDRCRYDGKNANCFRLKVCFTFKAQPEDRFTDKIRLSYEIIGETHTGRVIPRVYFKGAAKDNRHVIQRDIELNEQTSPDPSCDEHLVYLISNNRDFLNPIQMQMKYKLADIAPPTMRPGGPLPDINDYPVLNQAKAVVNIPVDFKKNCGSDDECQSQLVLRANVPQLDKDKDGHYTLKVGNITNLEIRVNVRNDREDAHEASLWIMLPEKLYYINTFKDGKKISCVKSENALNCPVGNPMGQGQKSVFKINLDPKSVRSEDKVLEISLRVNTTSLETDPSDDFAKLTMKVIVETDVSVFGLSDPSEVPYGGSVIGESAVLYEDEIGLIVNHTYAISNALAPVSNVTVFISWPYQVANQYPQGKHLLYLMEPPMIDPPGRCFLDSDLVNPLKVTKRPGSSSPALPPGTTPTPGVTEDSGVNKRVKREYVIKSQQVRNPTTGKLEKVVILDCDTETAKCYTFRCSIVPMLPEDSVNIKLRSRLWNSTFLEDYRDVDHVKIFSKAWIEIDPKLNIKQTNTTNDVYKIETRAVPDIAVQDQEGVPLWVIIVSAVAGVLLLILLVVLLWKCGFFKRKRAGDVPDHKGTLQKKKKGKNSNVYYDDPYN